MSANLRNKEVCTLLILWGFQYLLFLFSVEIIHLYKRVDSEIDQLGYSSVTPQPIPRDRPKSPLFVCSNKALRSLVNVLQVLSLVLPLYTSLLHFYVVLRFYIYMICFS